MSVIQNVPLKEKYRRSESKCSAPSTSKTPASPPNSVDSKRVFAQAIILLTFTRRMVRTLRKPFDIEAASSNRIEACKTRKKVMISHPSEVF